jgi:predicted RNA-binding protein with PIN domain
VPYLLDGNNLIGKVRRTSRPNEDDRAALIAELTDRLRSTKATAILFFDGPVGRRTSLGSLSIREAGGSGADEAILREIGRSRAPRESTVVTADRGLARRVREAGARTISPEDFWSSFGASSKGKTEGARRDEERVDVEDWLKYFEDESNRER